MVFRGLIKDALFLYLAYRILKIWWYKEQVTTGIAVLVAVISLIVLWFMLERTGIIPKMT